MFNIYNIITQSKGRHFTSQTKMENEIPKSSIIWTTSEDGTVITKKLTDKEVWNRCNVFGNDRLIEGLEKYLNDRKRISSRSR